MSQCAQTLHVITIAHEIKEVLDCLNIKVRIDWQYSEGPAQAQKQKSWAKLKYLPRVTTPEPSHILQGNGIQQDETCGSTL